MLCPRDGQALAEVRDALGPGTKAHGCATCSGLFAEWKVAQEFFQGLGLSVGELRELTQQARRTERKTAALACTACGKGALSPFLWKGVELDLCEQCGATWLDRGELLRLTGKSPPGQSDAPVRPGERVVGVFEMFWDCAYCQTAALLGKTHRFCPKCGAPQDPARRYFPPPGKEVKANPEYQGADRTCPACSAAAAAKAVHCGHCGSPMSGAGEVARVADRSSGAPAPGVKPGPKAAAGARPTRRLWPWVAGGVAAVFLGLCGVAVLWTKDVTVTVQGHRWQREIDVETMRAVKDDAWCDALPSGAYAISRTREERSTKRVPDGQECTTRDVDRGDGTFERREECRTTYREEPVYDDRCHFTIDRWQKSRTERAEGQGLRPEPAWPRVALARAGNCLGCEREGGRRETYRLELHGSDGKPYACALAAPRWAAVSDGAVVPIKVGVLTGTPDCSGL